MKVLFDPITIHFQEICTSIRELFSGGTEIYTPSSSLCPNFFTNFTEFLDYSHYKLQDCQKYAKHTPRNIQRTLQTPTKEHVRHQSRINMHTVHTPGKTTFVGTFKEACKLQDISGRLFKSYRTKDIRRNYRHCIEVGPC